MVAMALSVACLEGVNWSGAAPGCILWSHSYLWFTIPAILPGKTVGDLDDIRTRYNAFQLASQLQFLSVTVEQAAVALKARNDNVELAASDLLGT